MPDGIELGKAYVQIVPSAKGIQGKLTEELSGESSRAGESAGQLFTDKLVGTIKTVLGTAAIGKVITDSINAGGALQQSLGGVETLFKDSADRVKAYAAQAYKTAGVSANDYMETTTSFAASLLSSVSNDTDAAAQLANMAMVDMSDNANKMGTDMQAIQNAYQGFAKQNYTMLDNLKLGYGGTQAEMQRLLNDAEKLSGVHYDLGNLADMYSAIHIIQTELGITGTTAKEAETTLTGSLSAMGAAFQNVLGNLALGEDLQPSLEALIETARTYLVDNLIPLVGNVVRGIPEVIATLAPAVLQTGTELVQDFTSGFAQGIPEFLASALPAILSFTEELRANFGDFVSAGIDLILSLANGLVEGLPELFAYIPDIVINIAGLINDNAPKILAGAVGLIVALGKGLIDSVHLIWENAGKIVEAIVSVISAFNWLNLGANLIKGLANGVKSMGGELLNAFKSVFAHPLEWLKGIPQKLAELGKQALESFTNALSGKQGVANVLSAAETLTSSTNSAKQKGSGWSLSDDVVDKAEVNAFRMQNLAKTVESTIPAYTKSGTAAATAAKKAGSAAKAAASVVNSYSDTVTELVGNMTRTTETVTEEMSDHTTQHKQVITETSRQMVEGVLKDIKTVTTVNEKGQTSIQQTVETVRDTASTVTSTFDSVVNGIKTSTQTITETLTDGTETTKQVITETYTDIINGALVTVERVRNIAADGTEQVAQTIKESSAKTLDGLWKEIQDKANEGILGTVDTLWNAVKSGDWLGIGKWAASALYAGLSSEQKQHIWNFAMNMVDDLNGALGNAATGLAQGAVGIGQSICNGITGGFDSILSLTGQLGDNLTAVFTGLKAPLSAAAKAISAGLSGGLTSSFPTIFAAMGTLVTTVGNAFIALLEAIGISISATGIGLPVGAMVIAAGAALAVAIAAIVANLGGSGKAVKTPANNGSSASSAITDTNRSLWDYEKESARPERKPRPSYEINQFIYSKAQTAADLMREARYEQERAVLAGV